MRDFDFGAYIRAKRKGRDWNQDKLANKAGFSTATMGRIERNETEPKIGTVMKIYAALGIPFPDTDDKREEKPSAKDCINRLENDLHDLKKALGQ